MDAIAAASTHIKEALSQIESTASASAAIGAPAGTSGDNEVEKLRAEIRRLRKSAHANTAIKDRIAVRPPQLASAPRPSTRSHVSKDVSKDVFVEWLSGSCDSAFLLMVSR